MKNKLSDERPSPKVHLLNYSENGSLEAEAKIGLAKAFTSLATRHIYPETDLAFPDLKCEIDYGLENGKKPCHSPLDYVFDN